MIIAGSRQGQLFRIFYKLPHQPLTLAEDVQVKPGHHSICHPETPFRIGCFIIFGVNILVDTGGASFIAVT